MKTSQHSTGKTPPPGGESFSKPLQKVNTKSTFTINLRESRMFLMCLENASENNCFLIQAEQGFVQWFYCSAHCKDHTVDRTDGEQTHKQSPL